MNMLEFWKLKYINAFSSFFLKLYNINDDNKIMLITLR